uniref:Uncharacterized protein n=1 Tax=uncultured bacterium A1Q1_fos_2140 TaxID=1256565 RepID=L7VWY9_9BACT|nr:hypothetical protein [uncultured bacterium A1Q1_fos_2140]
MTYTELLRKYLPENLKQAQFVGQTHFEVCYKTWKKPRNKAIPEDIRKMTDLERYRECRLMASLTKKEYLERSNTESMIQVIDGNTASREIMYTIYQHYIHALALAQKGEENGRKNPRAFQPLVNPDFYVIPPLSADSCFLLTICDEYLMLSLQQLRNLLNITANEAIEHVGDPNQSIHPLLCQVHQTVLKTILKREINSHSLSLSHRYHPHVLPGTNAFVKLLHLLYGRSSKMEYHEVQAAENQNLSHGWFAWLKAMPLLPAEAQNHQLGIIVFDKTGRQPAEKMYQPEWIFYPEEVIGLEFPILIVDSFINSADDMKAFKTINAMLGEIFEKSERVGKNAAEAFTNLARPGTVINQEIVLRLKRLYMVASRGMRYLVFCQDITVLQKQLPHLYKLFGDWGLFNVQQIAPIALETVSSEQLLTWAEQLREAGPELQAHTRLTFLSIPGNSAEAFERFWQEKYPPKPLLSSEKPSPGLANTPLSPALPKAPSLRALPAKQPRAGQHAFLPQPDRPEDRLRNFVRGITQDFSPGSLTNLFKSSNANRLLFDPLGNTHCLLQTVWENPELCTKLHIFLMKNPGFVKAMADDKLHALMKRQHKSFLSAGPAQDLLCFFIQTCNKLLSRIMIDDFSEKNAVATAGMAIEKLSATQTGIRILRALLGKPEFSSRHGKGILLNRIYKKYPTLSDYYKKGDFLLLHALIIQDSSKFSDKFTKDFLNKPILENGETPFRLFMKTSCGINAFLSIARENSSLWNFNIEDLFKISNHVSPIVSLKYSVRGERSFLPLYCMDSQSLACLKTTSIPDENTQIAQFIFNELEANTQFSINYALLMHPVNASHPRFTGFYNVSPWKMLLNWAPAVLYQLLEQKIVLPGYFRLDSMEWGATLDYLKDDESIKVILFLCRENIAFGKTVLENCPLKLQYKLLQGLADIREYADAQIEHKLTNEIHILKNLSDDFSEKNLENLFNSPLLNLFLFADLSRESSMIESIFNKYEPGIVFNNYLMKNPEHLQKISAMDLIQHLRWNHLLFIKNNTITHTLLLTMIQSHHDFFLNFTDLAGHYHGNLKYLEKFAAWMQTDMGRAILNAAFLKAPADSFFPDNPNDWKNLHALLSRKFPAAGTGEKQTLFQLFLKIPGIFTYLTTSTNLPAWMQPLFLEQPFTLSAFAAQGITGFEILVCLMHKDPALFLEELLAIFYDHKSEKGLTSFQHALANPAGIFFFLIYQKFERFLTPAISQLFSLVPGKGYTPIIPLTVCGGLEGFYQLQPGLKFQVENYLSNRRENNIDEQYKAYFIGLLDHMGENSIRDFVWLTGDVCVFEGKTAFEYALRDDNLIQALIDFLNKNRTTVNMFTLDILKPNLVKILSESVTGKELLKIFKDLIPLVKEFLSTIEDRYFFL